MCPIDAQRLRLVCSATSRTPCRYFSKSRLDRPWPWVTMQKRCAPAASAARACSRICSGSIIACIGVSASAKRDCAQKPQSSAQPPDLALTSEHMSVESPNRSTRASHARCTSASICAWSSISPRLQRFLAGDQRRHDANVRPRRTARRLADRAGASAQLPAPARRAFLGERAHPLAHVLRGERGAAQLDQLLLDLRRRARPRRRAARRSRACCPSAPAARCRQLARQLERDRVELVRGGDAVDQAPGERRGRVDVAAEQEQLARARARRSRRGSGAGRCASRPGRASPGACPA